MRTPERFTWKPVGKLLARVALGVGALALAARLLTMTSWFHAWVASKEQRIRLQADVEIEQAPPMLWAHRGLRGPDAPPNTAAAMRAAAAAGFVGVEMDLRCRAGSLWIAHDADEPGTPFSEVIAAVLHSQYVWLDFKQLSLETARTCAPALRKELPAPLRARTFIESRSLAGLDHLRAAIPGVRPIYTTNRWHWTRFSLGYVSLLFDLERHAIANVGVPARSLTPEFARALGGIGIFTWTSNAAGDIARQRAQGVDVILTDREYE